MLEDSVMSTNAADYENVEEREGQILLERSLLTKAAGIKEIDLSYDAWKEGRECFLLLLEARMMLREMAEHKVRTLQIMSGNLSIYEIKGLLNAENDVDEGVDYITQIQELKRQLVKVVHDKYLLESSLSSLESRIALLIQNRTSIHELDRAKKKQHYEVEMTQNAQVDFTIDKSVMDNYAYLFYMLQVEPKHLAQIAYSISNNLRNQFVEFSLLTLYGDAYSPREEYLILLLFNHAIKYEISQMQSPESLLQSDTVIPAMFMTYTLRKQGIEYIKNNFSTMLKDIISHNYLFNIKSVDVIDLLNTISVGFNPENYKEIDLNNIDASLNETQSVLIKSMNSLKAVCENITKVILESVNLLPYGLRYICKQIRSFIQSKFPLISQNSLCQIIGYFVYYRFIGVALVQPDKFRICETYTSSAMDLIVISKVLYNLFRLETFKKKDNFFYLNPWIVSYRNKITKYYSDLVNVPTPEDYLAVHKYFELTQKTKPIIIITVKEIVNAHQWVKDYVDAVKEGTEQLQKILHDIGDVPNPSRSLEQKSVQLQLEDKYYSTLSKDINDSKNVLYAETKELIIKVLKSTSNVQKNVRDITIFLQRSVSSTSSNKKKIKKYVQKIISNLEVLEELNLVSKADNYASLLREIALEVANYNELREGQKMEVERLKATLKSVMMQKKDLEAQISEFEGYLDTCRKNSLARSKIKSKPIKLSYKELCKRKVIISSDAPAGTTSAIKFYIKMPDIGKFEIEAKIGNLVIAKEHLDLDDLLEKMEKKVHEIDFGNITLSLPNTIYFINKNFLS